MTYANSTTNITPITLIGQHSKILGCCLSEQKDYPYSLGNTTHSTLNIADDSISTFYSAIANLAAKYTHNNAAMSQLFETNQTMQSNLNTIIQELKTSNHHMKYSATNTPLMHNNMNPNPPSMQHNPTHTTKPVATSTSSTLICSIPSVTVYTNMNRNSDFEHHQPLNVSTPWF